MCKEDVIKAQELGARFLAEVAKVKTEEMAELRDLRLRAGEYLRRGIYEIRAAASFVLAKDEERLSRYPQLYMKKKRRAGDNGDDEVEAEQEGTAETSPTTSTAQAPAPAVANATAAR